MVELFANNGDPDQMPRSSASDLGLHCLPVTRLGVSTLQWVNTGTKEQIQQTTNWWYFSVFCFFFFFRQRIGFNSSCKLSTKEIIGMKCYTPFNGKIRQIFNKNRLLIILPSMLSVNGVKPVVNGLCNILQLTSGADPGRFLRGSIRSNFRTYSTYWEIQTWANSGPRSDATERGVWSGHTLCSTHAIILHNSLEVKWTCHHENMPI